MSKNDKIVKFAQNQAGKEAKKLAKSHDNDYISKVLKNCKSKTLAPIKEKLEMSKEKKMRVLEQYICDGCDKVIEKPENGFVIQGNIFLASPSSRKGMIGNNFPETGEKFGILDVHENVFCKKCFCDALGLKTFEDAPKEKASKTKSSSSRSCYGGH